jgi:hypothetical protein
MEVNSTTSNRTALESVKPRAPLQQAEEQPANETRQIAAQEAKKANAEPPPKPVVNLQGQKIGGNVNTTA